MKSRYTAMILSAAAVIATAGVAIEVSSENANAAMRWRQFRAEGIHTCWSSKHIGYQCFVSGVGFSDQNEALAKLKGSNCCNKVIIGNILQTDGASTAFKMTKCTNMF